MIDPVRTGPVTSIIANAVVSPDVRRQAQQLVDVVRPLEVAPNVTLPRLLDLVADLAHAGPPLDYARIAQVRRAIADGSYKIDADALAKAIVSFAPKA